ncbi:MAG TPA: hypothetical protein VGC79_08575 [Polyangiaceae bacterium]
MRVGAHAWRCALVSAAAVLAVVALGACSPVGNTYDNPNRTKPNPTNRISLWTVQDADSRATLASGCMTDEETSVPSVQAAPGQRLVFEVREWGVEKSAPGEGSAYWCNDENVVFKAMAGWVHNLSCWDYPSSRGIRTLSWEAITLNEIHPIAPPSPALMSGAGYRMQLEVEAPGFLVFVPNGTCGLDGRYGLEVRAP